MQVLLFLAATAMGIGLFVGVLYTREGPEEVARLPGWVTFIGALLLPGQIALAILGFFYFEWWMWCGVLAGSLIFLGRWAFQLFGIALFGLAPFLNLFALTATAYGWLVFLELV